MTLRMLYLKHGSGTRVRVPDWPPSVFAMLIFCKRDGKPDVALRTPSPFHHEVNTRRDDWEVAS